MMATMQALLEPAPVTLLLFASSALAGQICKAAAAAGPQLLQHCRAGLGPQAAFPLGQVIAMERSWQEPEQVQALAGAGEARLCACMPRASPPATPSSSARAAASSKCLQPACAAPAGRRAAASPPRVLPRWPRPASACVVRLATQLTMWRVTTAMRGTLGAWGFRSCRLQGSAAARTPSLPSPHPCELTLLLERACGCGQATVMLEPALTARATPLPGLVWRVDVSAAQQQLRRIGGLRFCTDAPPVPPGLAVEWTAPCP